MDITLSDPGIITIIVLLISIPVSLWVIRRTITTTNDRSDNGCYANSASDIPNAIGGIPILGNALQYKDNPIQCLSDQQRALKSKLFRINLAGRQMIIVGSDSKVMKQIATQPSGILSARKAVADIGFEYTLGPINVYKGTDWHKRILKHELMSNNKFTTHFLPITFHALEQALQYELQQHELQQQKKSTTIKQDDNNNNDMVLISDLFPLIRRCTLKAQMDSLLSPIFLQEDPTLLEAFMIFQDMIEETTAKAAVLPRWIALPICLWPTQAARNKLIQRLIPLIQLAWKKSGTKRNNSNATTTTTTTTERNCLGPWMKTYLEEQTSAEEAAELIIGLLFAAHKNPSVGAAQCFCFCQSKLNSKQFEQAKQEAKSIYNHFQQYLSTKNDSITQKSSNTSCMDVLVQANTLRCCVLETMRHTAHTIGGIRFAEKSLQVEMEPDSAKSSTTKYHIRQGETVAIAHHIMHMEPSVWGTNATEFSIERPEWNYTNPPPTELCIPVDPYKFTTFSNGLHQCPGAKIALAMMEMTLALLLVYDAQLVGSLAPLCFERATLAQRQGPVPIQIRHNKPFSS